MEKYYLGADIGGTSIKFGRFQLDGKLVEKWEIKTRKEKKGELVLPDVVVEIKKSIKECDGKLEGVGVGVPGPVTEDGTVLKCANLGWGVFSCKEKLRDLLEIENVQVGNDASIAALGEAWKGGGRNYSSIIMVTLGTGIGGGVVIDGKIIPGFNGAAGEFGHIKVEKNEQIACGCGYKGCLEQYASAAGIVRLARNNIRAGSYIHNKENLDAKMIFDGAGKGDTNCLDIVDMFGEYLGSALANISCVIDTEAIVIGGGMGAAGEMLIDVVSKWYNKKSLYALQNKKIVLAELGNMAGIYGCVKMVLA